MPLCCRFFIVALPLNRLLFSLKKILFIFYSLLSSLIGLTRDPIFFSNKNRNNEPSIYTPTYQTIIISKWSNLKARQTSIQEQRRLYSVFDVSKHQLILFLARRRNKKKSFVIITKRILFEFNVCSPGEIIYALLYQHHPFCKHANTNSSISDVSGVWEVCCICVCCFPFIGSAREKKSN